MRFIAAASQCTQNCFEHHCMIVEASFALVFYGILSLASKLMWWSISPSHCRTRLCNALDAPFANRLLQSDYESSLGLHFKHNKCLAVFLFHPPFGLFFFSKRFTFKLFNLTVSPCVAYCTSFTPTPFSLSAKIRSFLRLNFIKSDLSLGHTMLWLAGCFPLWRTFTRPIVSMGSRGHFPAARDDIEMCVSLSVYK